MASPEGPSAGWVADGLNSIAFHPLLNKILVTDTKGNQIRQYNADDGSPAGESITDIGGDRLKAPSGLVVDVHTGYIYIACMKADGRTPQVVECDTNFATLRFLTGKAKAFSGMALAPGRIYVCDRKQHRIQCFAGKTARGVNFGSKGKGPGKFSSPMDVATDRAGNMYVCEKGNCRIQMLGKTGKYVRHWGDGSTNNGGAGDEEYLHFDAPSGVAFDSHSRLYVADSGNMRVTIFDPTSQAGNIAGQDFFIRSIPFQSAPRSVAVDVVTDTLYVLCADGKVHVVPAKEAPAGGAVVTKPAAPVAEQTKTKPAPTTPTAAAPHADVHAPQLGPLDLDGVDMYGGGDEAMAPGGEEEVEEKKETVPTSARSSIEEETTEETEETGSTIASKTPSPRPRVGSLRMSPRSPRSTPPKTLSPRPADAVPLTHSPRIIDESTEETGSTIASKTPSPRVSPRQSPRMSPRQSSPRSNPRKTRRSPAHSPIVTKSPRNNAAADANVGGASLDDSYDVDEFEVYKGPITLGGGNRPGKLLITAVKGDNLYNVQMIGKQDPYLICTLAPFEIRVKGPCHSNGARNPRWEEKGIKGHIMSLDYAGMQNGGTFPSLQVEVWDEESFLKSDRMIGHTKVPVDLHPCFAKPGVDITYAAIPLVRMKKKAEIVAGTVDIRVCYEPNPAVVAAALQQQQPLQPLTPLPPARSKKSKDTRRIGSSTPRSGRRTRYGATVVTKADSKMELVSHGDPLRSLQEAQMVVIKSKVSIPVGNISIIDSADGKLKPAQEILVNGGEELQQRFMEWREQQGYEGPVLAKPSIAILKKAFAEATTETAHGGDVTLRAIWTTLQAPEYIRLQLMFGMNLTLANPNDGNPMGNALFARFGAGSATDETAHDHPGMENIVEWWDLRILYDELSGTIAKLERNCFRTAFVQQLRNIFEHAQAGEQSNKDDGKVSEGTLFTALSSAATDGPLVAYMSQDVESAMGAGDSGPPMTKSVSRIISSASSVFGPVRFQKHRAAQVTLARQKEGVKSPRKAGGGYERFQPETRITWAELVRYCVSVKHCLASTALLQRTAQQASSGRLAGGAKANSTKRAALVGRFNGYMTADEAKNCTFGKKKRNKKSERPLGADGKPLPPPTREEQITNFLASMDASIRSRSTRLERARGERDYNARLNQKTCPSCGATQTYDEYVKRKKRCTSCSTNNIYCKGGGKAVGPAFLRRLAAKKRASEQRKIQLRKDATYKWEPLTAHTKKHATRGETLRLEDDEKVRVGFSAFVDPSKARSNQTSCQTNSTNSNETISLDRDVRALSRALGQPLVPGGVGRVDLLRLKALIENDEKDVDVVRTSVVPELSEQSSSMRVTRGEFVTWWKSRCPCCVLVRNVHPMVGVSVRQYPVTSECFDWIMNETEVTQSETDPEEEEVLVQRTDAPGLLASLQPGNNANGEEPLVCNKCWNAFSDYKFLKRADKYGKRRAEKKTELYVVLEEKRLREEEEAERMREQSVKRMKASVWGYEMPSWFDLAEIPVMPSSPDDEKSLLEAADAMSKRVTEEAAARNIPFNRIYLGGFSQGAVVALLVALRHKEQLGGAIMMSGWAPLRAKLKGMAVGERKTPIFYGHGQADDKVTYQLAQESAHCIQETGKCDVTFKSYPGMSHSACPQEFRHVAAWLKERLRG